MRVKSAFQVIRFEKKHYIPFLDGPHDGRKVRRCILHRPCWPTKSKSRKLLVASLLGTKNETTDIRSNFPRYLS